MGNKHKTIALADTGRSVVNPAQAAFRPRLGLVAAVVITTLALGACSSDDDDDDDIDGGMTDAGMTDGGTDGGTTDGGGGTTDGGDGEMEASDGSDVTGNFAVVTNDGTTPGSVTFFSPDLATEQGTLATGANEGVIFGPDGTLYQNSDADGATGLRAFNRGADRADMDAFSAQDRLIGSTPGKGLSLIESMNLLASCDITDEAADLKLYSTVAGESAQPTQQIDLPAACWDSTYVADTDTLYLALVDGTLAIMDDMADQTGTVSRLVRVVDADGMQVSVNFHGVSVEDDTVLVSDVGSADSPTDGALFVFSDSGDLDGDILMEGVSGPATLLGNPVDLVLVDGAAIVAEKSNDAILVFDDIASLSGDVTPDSVVDFLKPESIAVIPDAVDTTDTSDITSDETVTRLLVALNPGAVQEGTDGADNSSVGRIAILENPSEEGVADTGLSVQTGLVSGDPGQQTFRTLENIQLDNEGNGYAVFDVNDGSAVSDRGLIAIGSLDERDGTDVDTTTSDRLIGGANSGLTSPKGVEFVGSEGALIVSDIGSDAAAASLVVLSVNAGADTAPLFTVLDTGAAAIWDTDYDAGNDRLYAAGTAGDVLVYDDFFAMGASATPTRTLRVAADGVISNMHGIAYDEATDTLIATDVGDAGSATDGALYVIENASTSSGQVAPAALVSGPASLLGNPVDLAFDGTDAYIAEKSNDRVLIYRDVTSLVGATDTAADEAVEVLKPESVVLAR